MAHWFINRFGRDADFSLLLFARVERAQISQLDQQALLGVDEEAFFDDAVEPAIMTFLNGVTVIRWAEVTIGL